MRIDSNSQAASALPEASAQAQSAARAIASGQGQPAGLEDQARLSSDQASIQALLAQAGSVPEVRQEKVSVLSQLVGRGQYLVGPEQSAEAILSQLRSGV